MDFSISSDQRLLVDATQQAVERHIEPLLAKQPLDTPLTKDVSLEILKHGANLGLTAARTSEELGGSGLSALDYGLMCEQLPTAALFVIFPHETTVARLALSDDRDIQEKYLSSLIEGKRITCTAATEPGVGSNPKEIQARLKDEGDHYLLNGRKMWVSNVTIADLVQVTSVLPQGDERKLVRILVDREESEYLAEEIPVVGMKQSHLGEVVFDNCRVPKSNLIQGGNDVARTLTMTWLANRPIIGLCAVQMAQRAFDLAKDFAQNRSQFGRTIGEFQLIQERLADIETAIVSSRLLCYHALHELDRGKRANGVTAMAKRYAVSSCDNAIRLAMQVLGSMGLSEEVGLEQLARNIRMLAIPDGTPEILTLIQGREITGKDAFRG